MNKKIIVSGFASLVVAASVMAPAASAFWPFDGLFDKGEVKAAVTSNNRKVQTKPNKKTPVRATTLEILALKEACENIIDIGEAEIQAKNNKEDSTNRPNNNSRVKERQTQQKKMVVDKFQDDLPFSTELSQTIFVTKRRTLVNRCNQMLKLIEEFKPMTKQVENDGSLQPPTPETDNKKNDPIKNVDKGIFRFGKHSAPAPSLKTNDAR